MYFDCTAHGDSLAAGLSSVAKGRGAWRLASPAPNARNVPAVDTVRTLGGYVTNFRRVLVVLLDLGRDFGGFAGFWVGFWWFYWIWRGVFGGFAGFGEITLVVLLDLGG